MITELKENEIFVFGSNLAGLHGGGAARQAFDLFDAQWGIGEGLTGKCYAFPTLDGKGDKRPEEDLLESIRKFYHCAEENPQKIFLLTKVGCGIAGYQEEYMCKLFMVLEAPKNVTKPESWYSWPFC